MPNKDIETLNNIPISTPVESLGIGNIATSIEVELSAIIIEDSDSG